MTTDHRPDPERLLDRWLADAARIAPHAGRDWWLREGSLLLRGWSEPHRRYHTLQHLAEVLSALDELEGHETGDGGAGRSPRSVSPSTPRQASDTADDPWLLARTVAWYHDLHYDPRAAAGSNEHRSATLARDHLHRLGTDDVLVDAVEAGVLMTADHEVRATSPLEAKAHDLLHDADLWILSAPPERYAAYRRQVREEYAHVPEAGFCAGRLAILMPFATRDRLYRSGYAEESWAPRARVNLRTEIDELTLRG